MDKYYSKKHIKGLQNPKEYLVEDLASYVNYISKLNGENFYFRGESKNYLDITSSGLRGINSGGFNCKNTNIDRRKDLKFIELIRVFYNEVSHLLSNVDRENFIVFAQHHGIPTNLIDISMSPLVSLYFACLDSDSSNKEDFGFVYLIKKSSTMDISNIANHNLKNINFNILDYIADSNNKQDIFVLFRNYFLDNQHMLSDLLLKAIDDCNYYKIKVLDFEDIDLKDIENYIKKDSAFIDLEKIDYKISDKIEKIVYEINEEIVLPDYVEITNIDRLSYLYLTLIIKLLSDFKEQGEYINYINFLPIFSYISPNSFDRIRNQQGLFIYQGYYQAYESVYNLNLFVPQRIHPDVILVIKNKDKILKELDMLGINEKFIYNDFDSIAKYIKRKHL
ncbi:MAG: FRG domain-containing protein [Sarcina sp.]